MPQKITISGWEIEIPDCWRIEYNNFPDGIFRVEHLTSFDRLYKAVSDTGYTMTVDWVPPKSSRGVFVFKVASGTGFEERHYTEGIAWVSNLTSGIEKYAHGLCSQEHKKLWIEDSKPVYYRFKDRYFRFEDKDAIVYDAKTGKELFKKDLQETYIKSIQYDPFDRGFLVFFDYPPGALVEGYKNSTGVEIQNGIDALYSNKYPEHCCKKGGFKTLGLFDENMDLIWWAESRTKEGKPIHLYSRLLSHGKDYMDFSAWEMKVTLDPKTGKIIKHQFSK